MKPLLPLQCVSSESVGGGCDVPVRPPRQFRRNSRWYLQEMDSGAERRYLQASFPLALPQPCSATAREWAGQGSPPPAERASQARRAGRLCKQKRQFTAHHWSGFCLFAQSSSIHTQTVSRWEGCAATHLYRHGGVCTYRHTHFRYILTSTLFFDFHSHCLLPKWQQGKPCFHGVNLIGTALREGWALFWKSIFCQVHICYSTWSWRFLSIHLCWIQRDFSAPRSGSQWSQDTSFRR